MTRHLFLIEHLLYGNASVSWAIVKK